MRPRGEGGKVARVGVQGPGRHTATHFYFYQERIPAIFVRREVREDSATAPGGTPNNNKR